MKLKNLYRFSFDNMYRHKVKFCLLILLNVVILLLIGLILTEYNKEKMILNSCQNVLSAPLEKCEAVQLDVSELSEEKNIELVKEIYEMDGLLAVGVGDFGSSGYNISLFDGELERIQRGITSKDYLPGKNGLELRNIENSLLPYWKFEYEDRIDKLENQPTDTYYLILGNAYKDSVSVGDEYIYKSEDNQKERYVVAGILKKGQKHVDNSIVDPYEVQVVDCDYEIFIVTPVYEEHYLNDYISYAVDDEHSTEDIHNDIINIARKYGLNESDIDFKNAQKAMDIYNEPLSYILGMILDLSIIVIIATVLITICVQSVAIMDSFNMYGIMYANGATRKDIALILVLDNITKLIPAYIIAYCLGVLYNYDTYINDTVAYERDMYILNHIVIYQAGGILLLITAISIIVPLIIINKNTPAKLIRGIMWEISHWCGGRT